MTVATSVEKGNKFPTSSEIQKMSVNQLRTELVELYLLLDWPFSLAEVVYLLKPVNRRIEQYRYHQHSPDTTFRVLVAQVLEMHKIHVKDKGKSVALNTEEIKICKCLNYLLQALVKHNNHILPPQTQVSPRWLKANGI